MLRPGPRLSRRLAGVIPAAMTITAVATLLVVPAQAANAGPITLLRPASLVPARVCGAPSATRAACLSYVLELPGAAAPFAASGPTGLAPADFRSAYGLVTASATAGSGQTIALVEANDDPDAAADLGVYRSEFDLPPCTTANGCFRKVNQTGATTYPAGDQGWALEMSLDLDMASAICPNCKLLLVEANSQSASDLVTALNEAAALGATVISNSWGITEASSETGVAEDGLLAEHPGIPIVASSGDTGNEVIWPSASPYVTAVGGTTLTRVTGTARGWTESAWSSGGSGCSPDEAQPAWQKAVTAITAVCSMRATADVSADANPATGASVYDSYGDNGATGWMVVGGTSLAAPLVASVYALAGNGTQVVGGSYPYAHTGSLNDVTTGSNAQPVASSGGSSLLGLGSLLSGLLSGLLGGLLGGGGSGSSAPGCTNALCTAGPGWDGPTGLGTPDGPGAF